MATFSETAFFQGSLLRRQAQVFQGAQNKVSFVLASVFAALKWSSALFLVVTVFHVLKTLAPEVARRVPLRLLNRLADSLPDHPAEVGLAAVLITFGVFRVFGKLEQRFTQPDVEPAGRT